MVEFSLRTRYFPGSLRRTVVLTPLPIKSSLDRDILKAYRPVSHCHFISKIVEKLSQSSSQNAYCPTASMSRINLRIGRHAVLTEASFLRVHNDLLSAADTNSLFLVLLIMPAAFDIIDHDLFLNIFQLLGVEDTVFPWFCSYL